MNKLSKNKEQINNLRSQKTKRSSDKNNLLIDLQIEQLQSIQKTKLLTTPSVYIVFCSENKENTKLSRKEKNQWDRDLWTRV